MKTKHLIWISVAFISLSFTRGDKSEQEFSYPKRDNVSISIMTDEFGKFKEEWRGEDYYYLNEGKKFICSVLFYKLNKSEVKFLKQIEKESGVPKGSPVYPLSHFTENSKTKEYESNGEEWGDPNGDFMFRQYDVKEYQGQKINQKNMYAYTMFDDDIYVQVHLSKVLCTPEDSTFMRKALDTLKKKK